ncbi:MAG: HAD family hydrolase [Sporichthyaceae bacterium]
MPSAVLFDVDGTLIDSTYLHAAAWRRAALDCGFNVPTAILHRCIGMGADLLVREAFGEQPPVVVDALESAHARRFGDLRGELRAFDGAVDLLAAVRARGSRVVLATSAGAAELPALLETLGGASHADAVTGGAEVEEAKPHPDIFELAMARAGVDPGSAIAVGDAVWDVHAARRAGIGCVAVLSGGISTQEFASAGAVAVYPDVAALLRGLDASPLATLWS